jgi:hypothetical protein
MTGRSVSGVRRQGYGGDTAVPGRPPDRREALQSIDRDHANIQQHQVRLGRFKGRQRLLGTRVTRHVILLAEDDRENFQVVLIVVHE